MPLLPDSSLCIKQRHTCIHAGRLSAVARCVLVNPVTSLTFLNPSARMHTL